MEDKYVLLLEDYLHLMVYLSSVDMHKVNLVQEEGAITQFIKQTVQVFQNLSSTLNFNLIYRHEVAEGGFEFFFAEQEQGHD